MRIDVGLRERVILFINERPVQYLGPGRHRVFRPFSRVQVARYDLARLAVELEADALARVPAADLSVFTLARNERAVVFRRGRPALWLRAGEHQIWTAERTRGPAVRIEQVDTSAVATTPLADEVRALVPSTDYVEVTAPEGSVAVRYVDGVLDAVLPSGRHAAWTTTRSVTFAVIDLRERLLHVNGQEVMSRDRVSLRLNLSASFSVADARRLATVGRAPDELLYLAMQLVAREAVAARTLDVLLTEREALADEITGALQQRAVALGFGLTSFGVKDLILPGEMKALLNRVIEAQKEAEANVILRREETAAVRSMAQTAKVMAEQPLLARLKELEAYKDLAAKVGQVHLVLGESVMTQLQLRSGQPQ